jgi:hypothetical protein
MPDGPNTLNDPEDALVQGTRASALDSTPDTPRAVTTGSTTSVKPRSKRAIATAREGRGARAAKPRATRARPLQGLPNATAEAAPRDRAGATGLPRALWGRGRNGGLAFAERVVAGADHVAGFQDRLADVVQMPVLASVIRTQADLTREASDAYLRTTRSVLSR